MVLQPPAGDFVIGSEVRCSIIASPDALDPQELLASALTAVRRAPLELAPRPLADRALRVAHTGADAQLASALAPIAALGLALKARGIECDSGAALVATLDGWRRLGG